MGNGETTSSDWRVLDDKLVKPPAVVLVGVDEDNCNEKQRIEYCAHFLSNY